MLWIRSRALTYALGVTVTLTCLAVADERPAKPTGAVERAALVEKVIGIWTTDADARAVVIFSDMGSGTLSIVSPGRFRAAGLIQGAELIALVRMPEPMDGAPAIGARIGMLRIEDLSARPLRVSFAEKPGDPVARVERWSFKDGGTRAGRAGRPDRGMAADSSGSTSDSLPKRGDYVFVEDLPEAIDKVPPKYPEWARKNRIEGTVLVQALVGKDGLVKDVFVANSIPDLDDQAVACVKQWRFQPAKAGGRPVAVWVMIPVKFALR